jgi:hypothetical protein
MKRYKGTGRKSFKVGDKVVVQAGNTFDTEGATKTEGIVIEVIDLDYKDDPTSPVYTVLTPHKYPILRHCSDPHARGAGLWYAWEGCDLYSTNAVPSEEQEKLSKNFDVSGLNVLDNRKMISNMHARKMISENLLVTLSQGNPGALNVLMQLTEKRFRWEMEPYLQFVEILELNNITGSDIWCLYKDECGEDLEKLKAKLIEMK